MPIFRNWNKDLDSITEKTQTSTFFENKNYKIVHQKKTPIFMNGKVFKMWLVRFVVASLVIFVVLKISESWIFEMDESKLNPKKLKHFKDDVENDPLVLLRRYEREFFATHREPTLRNRRCDACRIVAHNFDVAFENAEEQLLGSSSTNL